MKLTIFNGSPKKEKGNTANLLKSFLEGFLTQSGNSYEIFYLYENTKLKEFREVFFKSEYVLMAFPLYMCSMPGCVKEFIESLESQETFNKRFLGFYIQFGFPEAIHVRPLEKYLERLSALLKRDYLGTIIMGCCEGVDRSTAYFNKRCFRGTYLLGKTFGETHQFDQKLLEHYARPEKWSILYNPIFKKLIVAYVNKFHWDVLLNRRNLSCDRSNKG